MNIVPQKIISSDAQGISIIVIDDFFWNRIKTDDNNQSATTSLQRFIELVPEINKRVSIKNILSPFTRKEGDITPRDWTTLAGVCFDELKKTEVNGLLIIHGMDTAHYTAAALSFMLQNPSKPVVLVKSHSEGDDKIKIKMLGIICGAHVAASKINMVGICVLDKNSDDHCVFLRGTAVRNLHTSRLDSLRPINQLPIAKVWPNRKIEEIDSQIQRSNGRESLNAVFDENVALIKTYPGIPGDILDHYLKNGCKGVVIEGTGLGSVHTQILIPAIQNVTAQGMFVFIASQTVYGRVNLDVYTNLRLLKNAGAVGLEDMLPEVAYVKLGWILGQTKEPAKIAEMMLTNYAGEMTQYSRTDTFLQ